MKAAHPVGQRVRRRYDADTFVALISSVKIHLTRTQRNDEDAFLLCAICANVITSMTMSATIVAICTSPRGGEPMTQVPSVSLIPGVGIEGDRYALRTGWWSDPKWPDQELTLFEAEVAEAIGIAPAEARRNLVTRNVRLEGLTGVRFRIGEAVIVGVRACDPCRYIEQVTRRSGLTDALAGINGGLRCHIEQGGQVRVGDVIELLGPAVE